MDFPEDVPFTHNENDVVEAYRQALRLRARRVRIETNGSEETESQQEERMNAIERADTLDLQYVAQFSY